jgi:hypothetical protein
MPFRFLLSDASVQDGLRRIGRREFEIALREIDDGALSGRARVHQLRKRSKRLRALLRLVRPGFAAFKAENAVLRNMAADLASLRDEDALIETYVRLKPTFGGHLTKDARAALGRGLKDRRNKAVSGDKLKNRLKSARRVVRDGHRRAGKWRLEKDGIEALAEGVERSYRKTRTAMAHGFENPTAAALHNWRGHIKDHWYQTRLLHAMSPPVIGPRRKAAQRLAVLLGDHHDLAVLAAVLAGDPGGFGRKRDVKTVLKLADEQMSMLEGEAFALGGRLFAHRPAVYCATWGRFWEVWQGRAS